MDNLERYKKRKIILNSLNQQINNDDKINQDLVNEFLNSNADLRVLEKTTQVVENHYEMKYNLDISQEEAKDFLDRFKKDFNQERFDKLIIDCKKDVINSIVTPFGLGKNDAINSIITHFEVGKSIAIYDKVGGNVDTIHNVRTGVYATEEEQKAYENKSAYDDHEKKRTHDGNTNYKNKKDMDNRLRQKGVLQNAYNDSTFDTTDKTEVDHVVSTYENHHDRGRVLAEIDNAEISNIKENLKTASKSVNASKGEDSVENFLKRVEAKKIKIQELENKFSLSDKEKMELERLKRTSDVDEEKFKQTNKKARKLINEKINKSYYTSGKFVKNTVSTGAKEGFKMGTQQAIGLVISELFTAIFDEILDIYKNGFSTGFGDDRFFSVLKERLKNIGVKIKDKWKDVAIAFKDGMISGFISNFVTTVINMFITTGKRKGIRIIRMIREGIYSLFKAIKLLLYPPENMSYEDAMHETKKLIATGLLVSLGIMIEEYVDAIIKSTAFLAPFSDTLSTIFVGAITGLAITMTVYYIDKSKNDKDALNTLLNQTDKSFENCELLIQELVQKT